MGRLDQVAGSDCGGQNVHGARQRTGCRGHFSINRCKKSFAAFSGCKVQPSILARDRRRVPRHLKGAAKALLIPTRSATARRMASASCDRAPCRQFPFPGPVGAPPPAPCIRQTVQPVTAGDWQGCPDRLPWALHRGAFARRWPGCMGLIPSFTPPPRPRWPQPRQSPARPR